MRRQRQQRDVVRHVQSVAAPMPSGAVEHHHSVTARPDVAFDLGEVQVHRFGIGLRQHETRPGAARGTDGTEQIGPVVTLVARRGRPAAARGPDAGQRALLADAGFVLPPDLDRLAACVRRDAVCHQIGKVFLNAS
jgi:hypothetical protein